MVATKLQHWRLDETDFPRGGDFAEQAKFLLRYAVLAPSSHNTQPWKFRIAGDSEIEVFSDESRWLKIADRDQRELHISVGCALENLIVAAAHFGFAAETSHFPRAGNAELVARLSLNRTNKGGLGRWANLFEFISLRSTFHETFLEREIPDEILRDIESCCDESGINLLLTGDDETRRRVDDLIARSDAMQFADAEFRKELAYWIGQGVFGNSWLMSQIGSLAVAHLNLGKSTAKADRKVLRSAPLFGLLTSVENDRASQVKTGRVFERIYLAARRHGLGVRPMSQIVQIPEHKEELKRLIPRTNSFPQQPFLLGYAEMTDSHTPRRSVEEVLVE